MSAPGSNQGDSANDPIDLLGSSPELQRAFDTARGSAARPGGYDLTTGLDLRHTASRTRPKREPASSEGDTDSDQSARRTRAFRRSSGSRSNSSSAQAPSSSTSQGAGTSSNPINVDESPRSALASQPPHSTSRLAHELIEEMRRSYIPGNPLPTSYTSLQNSQPMPRRPSASTPSIQAPSTPRLARLPSVVLPRWQPDAEVTYCPICHTQFSFFVRKHHCRKCGRVVCDACSPHRITIPYQYIVQPPGAPRISRGEYPASLIAGEGGYADFSGLGGGQRVRLCNPCVPDPNITPPQAQAQDTTAAAGSSGHVRSQSTVDQPPARQSPLINRLSAYMGAYTQAPDQYARGRSVTMSNHSSPATPGPQQPPSYEPRQQPRRAPASARPYRGPTAESSPVVASGSSVPSSSRAHAANRALPAVPQPSRPRRHHQIPEEDECPVCHRELPSRTLPNFEARREEHIASCIISHSSTPTQRGTGAGAGAGVGSPGEPSNLQRRTGMFPYKATEKDCVDSAECTICLEEFEVGVDMARLECLCRFHRRCINAWFERHPGQCPMHQHDGFGF